ncbi:MAG: Rdx family protein [Actinomycetota bacterium]|nr:Rdx family protein [Actinomycetota bacterium]
MTDLVIVPARGGVFEVEVDGRLVFSKKATGRHADYDEILKKIRSGA